MSHRRLIKQKYVASRVQSAAVDELAYNRLTVTGESDYHSGLTKHRRVSTVSVRIGKMAFWSKLCHV